MEALGRLRDIRRKGGSRKVRSLEEGQGSTVGQEAAGRFGVWRKVKEHQEDMRQQEGLESGGRSRGSSRTGGSRKIWEQTESYGTADKLGASR